jgi:hypothetical protein
MLLGLLLVLWVQGRRRAPESERDRIEGITLAVLAATVVLWLTGKVLSPQYLTWGIPLVLAVPGKTGRRLTWMAIATLTMTQIFYRGCYDCVFEQQLSGLAMLVVRQAMLLAWAAVTLTALRRPRAPA